jgi:tRNA-2-methylthio-N6-dimethylallyladenosine synthase
MPSFYLKTYGCQMNERDSEQVAQSLLLRGYRLAGDETEADVILLNTCSVRDMAEQKAIGKMGMLQRLREKRPHLVLAFLGCMAQSRGPELLSSSSRVDLVVGTQKFHRVADYVDELLRRNFHSRMDDQRLPIVDIEEERGSQSTIRDHLPSHSRATAFVSIMQGCNMHCAFCIVPRTRGAERSRSIGEITHEVRELAARGVKEVTLLGQIVNLYGRHEFEKRDGLSPFVQLIDAVCAVEGIARVRFTSPHPIGFREDLLGAFARQDKLVEHVHLPLQSGSDRILRAMRRGYTSATYARLVERLRQARPGIAITTDIIVGFPGETDEDYNQTRDLADNVGFDNAFVFRYSPRRDTPAAKMDQQVAEDVKEFRNQDLLEVINSSARAKLGACVGRRVQILCEGPSKHNPNRLSGRTRTNKIAVFAGSPRQIGQIFDVRITSASSSTLYGDPVLMEP